MSYSSPSPAELKDLSFFDRSVDDTLAVLATTQDWGLSRQTAQERLIHYGANQLAAKKTPSFLLTFLRQMKGFLILILVLAVVISALVGDWIEAAVILAIILLNALVGTIQERRAERALQSLKALAAPEARVLRDGNIQMIPARELVPGDVVSLEAGAVVPADLRLIDASRLQVDEASLTGEAVPVDKDASVRLDATAQLGDHLNCAYASTRVTYGRGLGVVTATGQQTQVGRIATLLDAPEDAPPLQQKLETFGRVMGGIVLIICGFLFIVGIVRNAELSTLFSQGFAVFWSQQQETVLGLLLVAVSLAVAAVPEGLPAVVTMTLALGTQRMLARNTLVRHLPSVETLGSATVICTDKTGTLTQNRMTVTEIWTTQGVHDPQDAPLDASHRSPVLDKVLLIGLSCNDAEISVDEEAGFVGDPTEGALLLVAQNAGVTSKIARTAEIPFDSKRKRMTTLHSAEQASPFDLPDGRSVAFVKGAGDGMLPLCSMIESNEGLQPLTSEHRAAIQSANDALGEKGLRVLCMAYRPLDSIAIDPTAEEIERDLVFAGLVAMQDPPRPEVAAAVETASRAGLRSIMITGDHAATAAAIAQQIGILRPNGQVVEGHELEAMSDESLKERIVGIDVFARVSPHHKVRIVEALKVQGHIVAMTGDGVNDAPALKNADIGIAMGITGTDVAKESADMVLVDDNYASIISAIEQGRIVYDNIRKTVFYLLTCNFAEIGILLVATLLGWPPPLTAIQLLWLNLVTDGAPALALAMERAEPNIMQRPPRPTDQPIIDRRMLRGFLVQSTALAGSVLSVFVIALQSAWSTLAGTLAFVTLVLAELFRAYSVRSEDTPLLSSDGSGNRWMHIAVLTSGVLLLLVLYVPPFQHLFEVQGLRLSHWGLVLPFALIAMLATESRKLVQRAWQARKS